MASGALLELRGLRKVFGGVAGNDGILFNVPSGAIAGLIGPNGSGKTTLFNLVTGPYSADAGSPTRRPRLQPLSFKLASMACQSRRGENRAPAVMSILTLLMVGQGTRFTGATAARSSNRSSCAQPDRSVPEARRATRNAG